MPRRVRSHLVTRSHLRLGGLALAAAVLAAALAPLPGVGAGRPSNPRAQAVRKVFPSAARVRITAIVCG